MPLEPSQTCCPLRLHLGLLLQVGLIVISMNVISRLGKAAELPGDSNMAPFVLSIVSANSLLRRMKAIDLYWSTGKWSCDSDVPQMPTWREGTETAEQ